MYTIGSGRLKSTQVPPFTAELKLKPWQHPSVEAMATGASSHHPFFA